MDVAMAIEGFVMRKRLLCFAEERGGAWEAFCLDLDLAVQGSSFEEVYSSLNAAILDYVGAALKEDTRTAESLLNRKAPLWERLRFYARYVGAVIKPRDDKQTHGFTLPCPA
jgi:hypothetical protein